MQNAPRSLSPQQQQTLTPKNNIPLIFTKFLFLFHSNSNNNNIKAEVYVFAHTAPNHGHGSMKTFEIGWQVFCCLLWCVFSFLLHVTDISRAFIIYFLFFCFILFHNHPFPPHYIHQNIYKEKNLSIPEISVCCAFKEIKKK